ncbi:MAG: helix-turn-helix transcriptional regulator [Verrucomicrobia bacterium]|nr:helix-turn-helix transcriptional regulator [Verrucomicrobiota bacterium]
MLASVGQALRAARLKKNISVEEASRATKIRAARIVDLENDEYTRFPNITYARSFLLLYGKFLGVDISKYPTVEAGSTVGLADYQYLQSGEGARPEQRRPEPKGPPEKPRWLIAFFVFLVMLALGALVGWYVMNFRRLGSVENLVKKDPVVVATPTPSPTPTPTPPPAATPEPTPQQPVLVVPPPLRAIPVEPSLVPPPPLPSATPTHSPMNEPEVRRAEPITSGSSDAAVLAEAAALATPSPTPAAIFPPEGEVREIKVRVTKRIKVRIVRDNVKSSSLYYGYMNPAQPVLSSKGKKFWIKATDPSALQVTVNGQPVTGPEAGVEIIQSGGL